MFREGEVELSVTSYCRPVKSIIPESEFDSSDLISEEHTDGLFFLNDQTLAPFFQQLNTEVEHLKTSWETLRRVQDKLEVEELRVQAVEEEDLSELLKLQKSVNNKIHQSESILDLTSSFQVTGQQVSRAGR